MEENLEQPTIDASIPAMVDDVRAGKMQRRNFIKILSGMGITAVGVGAIAGATLRNVHSLPFASHPTTISAQEHLDMHSQHLAHQSQGNINALHNDYAHNAIVEDSMHDTPFVGREAIMARKGVGMAAIPDLKIKPTNRVVHGNQVTVEWYATGTHTGDFPGLPASGRTFSFHGVTVVVREQGKITRESIYYSMDDVRKQLSV